MNSAKNSKLSSVQLRLAATSVFHCGPLSERYHGYDSAASVLAIDHASRFVDCRDRSQAAVIAPTMVPIFRTSRKLRSCWWQVACNPSPEWVLGLKCLVLLRIWPQSSVTHDAFHANPAGRLGPQLCQTTAATSINVNSRRQTPRTVSDQISKRPLLCVTTNLIVNVRFGS